MFDVNQFYLGYVYEFNCFGWVVEVDFFDLDSILVKYIVLGWLCWECVVVLVGDDGCMVVYFGDDIKGEYIYKFVLDGVYKEGLW